MSKFSEKCKELLIENGYNVYRLSQADISGTYHTSENGYW